MTDLIHIAHNAVVAKLVNSSREVNNIVGDVLSYRIEGVDYMPAFQSSGWDGRSSFFSHRSQSFPAGFVHLIHSELSQRGYRVQLVRKPHPAPLGPENPIVDSFGNDDPRYDYQLQALREVERHGRGILQVATGGGKSKIAKLIAARFRRMTLFLTTRGVLMYQMGDGFKDAGLNVGVMGDGEWKAVKGVNVAMVQTLVANLKEPNFGEEMRAAIAAEVKKTGAYDQARCQALAKERFEAKTRTRNLTIKILEMVEVVIGEEAHEAGGNSYYEILKHCKNAQIRVALTATPFMRENIEDNMRLMAAFGPRLIHVSEQTLIERGILATPYFKFVRSTPHPKLRKTSPWQRAYQLGYVENTFMIADIARDARKAADHRLPVLTLVQRKSHGLAVLEAMRNKGLKVAYIKGENDQEERKRELRRLAAGEIDVLIGTNILDVGVDVPAVGLVQLAGGGKAEVATRQRIGRGLRAKKNGPNVCFVVDYTTAAVNKYLDEHAAQRRAIIEQTEGFKERILAPGKDFDWTLFTPQALAS